MSNSVSVKHNIPAFLKQMSAFSLDMEKNIFRAGIRAAGTVFKKRVEQLAPVGPPRKRHVSGTLKRNIILVRPKQLVRGLERQYVAVRAGRQKPKKGQPAATLFLPFYWAWVEAGHRKIPRGGKITGGRRTKALKRARFDASGGRTKPVEYLKRAFQEVGENAIQAFNDRVEKRIAKENATRTPKP